MYRKPTVPSYLLDRHGTIRFNGFGHEASENAPVRDDFILKHTRLEDIEHVKSNNNIRLLKPMTYHTSLYRTYNHV